MGKIVKTLISYIEGFPNHFVRGKAMKTKISYKLGVRFEWLWSKRGETRFIIYGIGFWFFFWVLFTGTSVVYAKTTKTVAVVPFQNLTGDDNINWIGEGIASELRRKFSNLKGLSLLSRRDIQPLSAKLAGTQIHDIIPSQLNAISEAIEADLIITGGYQRTDGELSVLAYTITYPAQSMSTPLGIRDVNRSIFTLINDLAVSILPSLGISPTDKERALLLKNQTNNLNAFVYYSRSWSPFLKDDIETTIAYCREALRTDPYYEPVLYRLIEIYERLEKWPEASKIYKVIEEIAKKENNRKKLIAIYEKFIKFNFQSKNYKNVGLYCNSIIGILQQQGDLEGVYNKYIEIAEAYMKSGMRDQPIKFYLKALEIQKKIKNKEKIGDTYQALGEVFVLKNMDRPALRYFEKALAIRKNLNSKKIPYTLGSIGEIELRRHRYPKAKKLFDQTLELAKKNDDKKLIARVYNDYGLLHFFNSNNKKALDFYEKALVYNEDSATPEALIETYDNIGTIYSNEENYPKALEYFRKSLALRKKAGSSLAVGRTTLKIANVLREQKKFDEALKTYQKAHELLKEGGSKRDIASIYSRMGSIYEDRKDFSKTLEWYRNTAQVQRILEDEMGLAGTYFRIGRVYDKMGKVEKAIRYVEKTVELDRKNRYANLREDQRYLSRLKKKMADKKKELNSLAAELHPSE
jgi:tetratricopeptide (TPR) repeat protein/TolB-like protein